MQPLKVEKADHVGFVVGALEPAIRFFVEALGATLQRRGEMGGAFVGEVTGARGADLRTTIVALAGFAVELLEYRGAPSSNGPQPPYALGMAHLALVVTDLDAVLERIADHGWRPQGTPQTIPGGPRAGTRVIYTTGPSGETIEFMQPPA